MFLRDINYIVIIILSCNKFGINEVVKMKDNYYFIISEIATQKLMLGFEILENRGIYISVNPN